MRCFLKALRLAALVALVLSPAQAQDEEGGGQSLSRRMRLAVRLYEKGEDLQAMDRFMEILTGGDPSERPMANEYINLITQRMNTGERDFQKPAAPAPAAPSRPRAAATEEEPPRRAAAEPMPSPAPRPEADPQPEPTPQADKAVMRREIKAKIRQGAERALRELRAVDDVRVIVAEDGEVRALGIPAPLLYSSGVLFQKGAGKLLDSLTRLVYGSGSAKVLLLPEGAVIGDAKVLDMRRAMGVHAHLLGAGLAPARVKVNLLSAQLEVPKGLRDFKGLIVVLDRDQPVSLSSDVPLSEEGGPPVSLGVSPGSLSPDKGEGVIIELSVAEPPAGLVSWKFQLLAPALSGAGEPAPVQEVVGGAPVFHQIYWNGRKGYFGPVLPPGRYEAVLSATDSKSRQRTMHRWIQLTGEAGVPQSEAAPDLKAPSAELPSADPVKVEELVNPGAPAAPSSVTVKKPPKPAAKAKKTAPKAKKAAPKAKKTRAKEKAAQDSPKETAEAGEGADADLQFQPNTHQLTAEGEKLLARAAAAAAKDGSAGLKLTGFAQSSETDAAALAERRAQMAAGLLINKYRVDPKRIQLASTVAEVPAARVELRFERAP